MLVADLRSRHNLEKRRCVKVSQGKIRFVQLEKGVICLWTLLDSESPKWRLEYKAPLSDLWDDETYKTSGLTPGKVSAIALIDPTICAVVYFMKQNILFAVDMRSKRVLMSKKLEMGSDFYRPSRFLHPWVFQSNLFESEDGPGESNKLPSNDLHDQSDSEVKRMKMMRTIKMVVKNWDRGSMLKGPSARDKQLGTTLYHSLRL